MLGKATYLDKKSKEVWSSFGRDMKDWLEEMRVIPVEEESLFPSPAELFAQGFKDGKTDKENWDYIDAIYKDKFKITLDDGSRVKYVPSEHERGTGYYNRYVKDGDVSHFLSVTDRGVEKYKSGAGASPIHEYFHYLDMIMNKAMGDKHGGAGIAARMASYNKDEEENLSSKELLERWMNDPATAHLDFENPNDPRAGIVTGGRNNPRKLMGKFLASMLNDEQYQKFLDEGLKEAGKEEKRGYYSNPSEMLAHAAQPIVKETSDDKSYQKVNWFFGTDWNLEGLDRDLANSISSYVNKRKWDEEHPDLVGTEFDVFRIKR